MKYIAMSAMLLTAFCAVSCQRSVSMVPPNSRPVVGPEGSSATQRSWSRVTEQEGNAVLGPLSNMRR